MTTKFRVSRKGAMLGFATLFLLFAGRSVAESGSGGTSDPSANRSDQLWIPGISTEMGFLVHQRNGFVESDERGRHEGDSNALFGAFGFRAELSSPRLSQIPTQPRLFGYTSVGFVRDKDEAIANEGDPGNPLYDLDNDVDGNTPVAGIVGVGTSLRVESEPLILGGGLGASFETEIATRTVRFKPTLDWTYQRDKIEIAFADAEGQGADPARCNPCQVTAFEAQTEKGYHNLGPGMEIDVDAGRLGEFVVSVFTRFQALRILGDRQASLDATGSWFTRQTQVIGGEEVIVSIDPVPGREDTTVNSRYRRDSWSYYGAAGIRILWSPE